MRFGTLIPLKDTGLFTTDPVRIDARLRRRLGRSELVGLIVAAVFLVYAAYLQNEVFGYEYPPDYYRYMEVARFDFSQNYYAYWIAPVFWVLGKLPTYYAGYLLWGGLSIAGIWFAARVFGGNVLPALISYQMLYVLYYGQIAPILIGGLALMWWSLAHKRVHIAGFGWVLAATKFQLGVPIGLFLLLLSDTSWRERALVLVVPVVVTLASLIGYGLWPLDLLDVLLNNPPNQVGSVSLWQWIGPTSLVLWLPPIFLNLTKERRMLALTAALALAVPYFQQTDLLMLYMLPVGWLALLGNLGYLFLVASWFAFPSLVIVPLIAYGVSVGPSLVAWVRGLLSSPEDTTPQVEDV